MTERYSSYTSERWDRATSEGSSRHQKAVQALCAAAGVAPEDAFSINAVFIRTKDSASIEDIDRLWNEHFWPIHQQLLEVVSPSIIIALGNDERKSSYRLLMGKAKEVAKETGDPNSQAKVARVSYGLQDGKELSAVLIGIPHPSRFSLPRDVLDRIGSELGSGKGGGRGG